jgi:hypothetical protein
VVHAVERAGKARRSRVRWFRARRSHARRVVAFR